MTFRWGYGWNYKRPYSAISAQEELAIAAEFGKSAAQLKQSLKENFTSLSRMCDTYDYGLQKMNSDDQKIFELLSERIKTADIIEWAKPGYFNLEKREILVKLQTYQTPITFTFFKKGQKVPELVPNCRNLEQ